MSADRREIKSLISRVAESQLDTYDRASEVWSYSFGRDEEDWIYGVTASAATKKTGSMGRCGSYGVLTDWVEVKPDETEQAEATMREAAQAFLPIADDDDALRLYFDRWLYEERGGFYERPEPPPQNPPFRQNE